MKTLQFRIEGTLPLLMHNVRLANPLDPFQLRLEKLSKISAKKRSQQDWENVMRAEWEGGLYTDEEGRPCVPATCVNGFMYQAARQRSLGPAFGRAGLFCTDSRFKYPGPSDLEALWANENFRHAQMVTNPGQRTKILRVRPRFHPWSLTFDLCFEEIESVSVESVAEVVENGGRRLGLGDGRPQYGRFEVKEVVEL